MRYLSAVGTVFRWLSRQLSWNRIGPNEKLLRLIPKDWYTPNREIPFERLAFKPGEQDTDGVSLYRETFVTPEQLDASGRKPGNYYAARLSVRDIRALNLTVVPTKGHLPGHAVIPELKRANYEAMATGTSFNQINFWDAKTGERLFMLQGPRSDANLILLSFSPDGSRVAVASAQVADIIQVWDIARASISHEFFSEAKALSFSSDGKKLLTGHMDGTVLVWDLTLPAAAPRKALTRQEIEERWERQACGFDGTMGNRGSRERTDALVEGGDLTVAFLEEVLLDPALPNKDRDHVRRLIAPLANAKREVREQTIQEIARFGDHAWLAVKNLADVPPSPEVLKGVEDVVLRNFEYRRSSHGAIDVLRQIGTVRARRLLEKLAEGSADTAELNNRRIMATYALDELKELRRRE